MHRILLLLFVLISGCTGGSTDTTEDTSPPPIELAPPQQYHVAGRIEAIPPSRQFATIHHGAIDGLMESMTMVFPVTDSTVLEGFAPGDSIRFELVVNSLGGFEITHITGE